MRWSSVFLPFTLLAVGAVGALTDSPSERFLDLHKKSLASVPLKLDDASYKKATAQPRDYSVAVLLTATDPRFGCQMCREFGPDWNLLSSQWIKGDKAGDSKMVFSLLDFNDGRDTFMSLGLQTAPVLLLFQPTTGEFAVPSAEPLRFDFNSGKPSAETAREWIIRNTPGRHHPEFTRPTDWFKIMVSAVTILGLISALYAFFPYIEIVWTSKYVWRIVGLFWILAHSSGFMFNSIRGTQYAGQDGKGGISYIAGGFQSQYQLESQIIGVAYGLLALSAIALADKIPRLTNPRIQSIAVLAWAGFMLVGYSLLLSIFRIKNGGYPFALPPFL